jgi:hypothetical protein
MSEFAYQYLHTVLYCMARYWLAIRFGDYFLLAE